MDQDELLNIGDHPDSPSLNLIKDTFAVLCSKELKVGSRTRGEDEELPAEILESKKTVLSKVNKKDIFDR